MKIAYLILAHNTPNHMSRMIRALDSPNAIFFVHVDRRSDISLFRNGLWQPNAIFLKERFDVYWDDFSKVDATIELIRQAVKSVPTAEYIVLLSGSDYPLRSPRYIEDFFLQNQGQEFINLVHMPCDVVGKPIERLQRFWLPTPYNSRFLTRALGRLNDLNWRFKVLNRDYKKVFNELLPYGGSTWWALTADACRHILHFIDSKPDVLKFYRNTYMPDESLFQTIIGNSKFAEHVVRNLTFTDWSRPSGGPAIIDMAHLNSFVKSGLIIADDAYGRGELLFARKFPDDSAPLTDFIDVHVIGNRRNDCDALERTRCSGRTLEIT